MSQRAKQALSNYLELARCNDKPLSHRERDWGEGTGRSYSCRSKHARLHTYPHPPLRGTFSQREKGSFSGRPSSFSRRDKTQRITYGCTTVIVAGVLRPTPRSSGRYMSSASDGGTVYVPGVTARTR